MNRIHESAVIGPGVELGDDNVVGPGAVILGPATVGSGNWIGPNVVIGTPAEMRDAPHPAAWEEPADHGGLLIGDNNVLRDGVVIHAPHFGQTRIGSDCYVMNNCYVGHDGNVADGVTMASTVVMGGHCRIGEGANLGLAAVLHQRTVVGEGAMVGMGAVLTRNVPPFAKAFGNPCRVQGANVVGMERLGINESVAKELDSAYADWPGPPAALPVPPDGLQGAFERYAEATSAD
ncbi:MAG: UDP-N-acetylglucosamine acyltransferase [Actinomycetia bacterium]|nr:UDP-N-acetylglucosamine acyltransferase [Actinomycetes bacterium]